LYIGNTYYEKGVSIPIRETLKLDANNQWDEITFRFGVSQFLYPDIRLQCQLLIYGDNDLIYESPIINESSKPIDVSVNVKQYHRLKIHLVDKDFKINFNSGNWADMNYLGAELVNFAWKKSEASIDLSEGETTYDATIGYKAESFPLPYSSWVVKYIPASATGNESIILSGGFDNSLRAYSLDMQELWKIELGGLPYVVDYVGKGDNLRFAAHVLSEYTDVTFFTAKGEVVNQWENPRRNKGLTAYKGDFYAIDESYIITQLSPDGNKQQEIELKGRTKKAPKALKIHDLGDGRHNYLIGTSHTLLCYNQNGEFEWECMINPYRTFLSSTNELELYSKDGEDMIIAGSRPGALSKIDMDGNLIWRDSYIGWGHSIPEIAIGDFVGDEEEEIVALSPTGWLHLFNFNGQRLRHFDRRVPFVDFSVIKNNEGKDILLSASSSPRDKHLYKITFDKSGTIHGDKLPEYRIDYATNDLINLNRNLSVAKSEGINKKQKTVTFQCEIGYRRNAFTNLLKDNISEGAMRAKLKKIKEKVDDLSNENVRFLPYFYFPLDVYEESELNDIILKVADECERIGLKFGFEIVLMGNFTDPDVLKEILNIAPNTCAFFAIGENMSGIDYHKEVLELIRLTGVKLLFYCHRDYWIDLLQNKEVFHTYFNERYADVIIPGAKSNPSCMNMAMSVLMNLQEKGLTNEWGIASQHWNWNFYTRNINELYPYDILLRHQFQAASMGATWYKPEGDFFENLEFTKGYKIGREPFYKMLQLGMFPMDNSKQNKSISPVILNYACNIKTGVSGLMGKFKPGDFLSTGLRFAQLQTVSDFCYTQTVSGAKVYADALLPQTNNGFVMINPVYKEIEDIAGWATDGIKLYHNGELQKNENKWVDALNKATKELPISSNGSFVNVQEVNDKYYIYVSTTGYFYPEQEEITLNFNKKIFDSEVVLKDIINGGVLRSENHTLELSLNPGTVLLLVIDK